METRLGSFTLPYDWMSCWITRVFKYTHNITRRSTYSQFRICQQYLMICTVNQAGRVRWMAERERSVRPEDPGQVTLGTSKMLMDTQERKKSHANQPFVDYFSWCVKHNFPFVSDLFVCSNITFKPYCVCYCGDSYRTYTVPYS